MKKNLGSVDRIVRSIIAILFSVLFLTQMASGVLGTVLLAISAILLLTSLFSVCPSYIPFKVSTCKIK